MVDLANIQRIYFIGIGGIGMSALARYFFSQGKIVSGYDRTETTLTRQLAAEGIPVMYADNEAAAPTDADLVVYTPAVPADHAQLNYYRKNGYEVAKRSEVLGAVTQWAFNICVAGTHGKTTISTMIAHILRHTGFGCNAFLGGIAANYNSNFWSSERNLCVIEADEYDRSFLKLSPNLAVISATDADHLDIYGTEEAMQDAFADFSKKVKEGGTLFSKAGLQIQNRFEASHKFTYGIDNSGADIYAYNVRLHDGHYIFDVKLSNENITDVELNMGGMHNVENATVAIAVARLLAIDTKAIKEAVNAFRGVKRRFEYIVKGKDVVYIDDYAHHPAELAALIGSAMRLFPSKTCTVIFQPHLFTRTKDFADGFADSLAMAHEVLLLPIYPAREVPIPGVSSDTIANKIKGRKVKSMEKSSVGEYVRQHVAGKSEQLLITAGAGDIDTLVPTIQQILTGSSYEHKN